MSLFDRSQAPPGTELTALWGHVLVKACKASSGFLKKHFKIIMDP